MLKRGRSSRGVALLEALIALALLSGVLLALLYTQLRMQADSESALRRSQALHLIDDLGERIRANPGGAAQLVNYRSDWGAAPAPDADCEAQPCSPVQLALWDISRWKGNVSRVLPNGDALVFAPPSPPDSVPGLFLGVMVGWTIRTDEGPRPGVPGATCPKRHACQFGHVHP